MGNVVLQVPDLWLTFLIGVVLPALVALVTKQYASGAVKAVLLAALSAVTGVVVAAQTDGGALDLTLAFTSFVMTFVTSVVMHYGLLKPVGVTGSEGVIAQNVPGGVG